MNKINRTNKQKLVIFIFILILLSISDLFSNELINNHINHIIRFTNLKSKGTKLLKNYKGIPDNRGILGTKKIRLPSFEKICIFATDNPKKWPAIGNRIYPFLNNSKLNNNLEGGIFILLKIEDNSFLALVPLTGKKSMSWFSTSSTDDLLINIGNFGTANISTDIPLFSWTFSSNPYHACHSAWQEAVNNKLIKNRTDLRIYKKYPEIFKHLGWCSWEECKQYINEEILVYAINNINQRNIPVKYIIVDRGHEFIENQTRTGRKNKSFLPDKLKFPNGWNPIMNLKNNNGIRWIGLWHSFQGEKNGLSKENDFGEDINNCLTVLPSGIYLPKPTKNCSEKFYNKMIEQAKKHGFDFIKIDNQSENVVWYQGTDNAVQAASQNAQALETAANNYMNGMLNCMALNPINIFNTKFSSISRNSRDYKFGDILRAKLHIWQSYHNALWQGQTIWCDYDMFHSSDPVCGKIMALSKSISGGPIYLSDDPTKFKEEYILPLCFKNGKLLRPLAPATPLPESIFIDPIYEKSIFRVIAPLTNQSAAITVNNIYYEDNVIIEGYIKSEDFESASAMIQPYKGEWKIPEEGLILYDWYEQKGLKLDSDYNYSLKGFDAKLFLLSPIKKGWSIIGNTDKYLSPCGVEIKSISNNKIIVRMIEEGPLMIWRKEGNPFSKDITFNSKKNGFWYSKKVPSDVDIIIEVTN